MKVAMQELIQHVEYNLHDNKKLWQILKDIVPRDMYVNPVTLDQILSDLQDISSL